VTDIRPFGDGAGSSSRPRRRFPEPPDDPGRSDVPSPVRGHHGSTVRLPRAGPAEARGRHTPVARTCAHRLATGCGRGCLPGSPRPCVRARHVVCPQARRERRTTFSGALRRPEVPVLVPPRPEAWRRGAGSWPRGPPTAGPQDLPDVIAAPLARRAWTPTPAAREGPLPVSSPMTAAFPP
jgi:hypothetical protein